MLSWSPVEIDSFSHFLNFKKLNLFNIQKILVLIHTFQLASDCFQDSLRILLLDYTASRFQPS